MKIKTKSLTRGQLKEGMKVTMVSNPLIGGCFYDGEIVTPKDRFFPYDGGNLVFQISNDTMCVIQNDLDLYFPDRVTAYEELSRLHRELSLKYTTMSENLKHELNLEKHKEEIKE